MTVTCTETRLAAPEPDYGRFAAVVAEATAAFGHDVSYAVAIARAAVTLSRRRRR